MQFTYNLSANTGYSIQLTVGKLSKFIVAMILEEGDLYMNVAIPGKHFLFSNDLFVMLVVTQKRFAFLLLIDLAAVNKVYVTTDIMMAGEITAVITGDDDSFQRISLSPRPIGFGYSKFRLSSDGLVGQQVVGCTNIF